jgi:predicted RNA binding protein YcfA (HicA-like mRNA interferase family)
MKVGAVIKLLEADGWGLARQTGSHRQFRHPIKPGTVTVAGKPSVDLPGLGVAGDSVEEVERLIREAIPLHIESLRAHGEPVPPPTTVATAVIPAPADLPSASAQG